MRYICSKSFANGTVYLLETDDGYPVEVTDTFLPIYTRDAISRRQNSLESGEFGSRADRWMIGVSTMSGCPVGCKFCATGKLDKWRRLTAEEIIAQVQFVIEKNPSYSFVNAGEHKINYTRMGEPFLNISAVREAIDAIDSSFPSTHHYVSTIGIRNSNYGWISENVTLQLSLHALTDIRRDELIPFNGKLPICELGKIRTESALKTTLNLTIVGRDDFDIKVLKKHFDPKFFFVKISPINPNDVSSENGLGDGVVNGINLI